MSNARDKANIPALNFSSTGIDDNATSTAITIDSSERVGIGTSSPDNILMVSSDGASASAQPLSIVNPVRYGTNDSVELEFGMGRANDTNNLNFPIIGLKKEQQWQGTSTTVDASVIFKSVSNQTASERMRIDSSGKVGIATSSPIEKMTVNGAIVSTSGNSTFSTSGANRAILDFTSGGARLGHFRGATASGSGYVSVFVDSSVKMHINSSGNVGIGTSSPQEKLHIETPTGSASETGLKIRNGTSANDVMAQIKLQGGYTATSTEATAIISGGRESSSNASKLTFSTGQPASERMRIDRYGRVGIGTSSPLATLHVEDEVADNSEEASFLFGRSKKHSGYVSNVTASTGTIIFQISSTTSNYRSALCKLSLHCRQNSSSSVALHASAVYYFTLVLGFGGTANFATSPLTAVYLQCIVLTTFSESVSKFGKDHSYVIAIFVSPYSVNVALYSSCF